MGLKVNVLRIPFFCVENAVSLSIRQHAHCSISGFGWGVFEKKNQGVRLSTTIDTIDGLGWDVSAEGFFGHVVASCGVGPCSAAAAEVSKAAEAALAFEAVGVAHSRQIFAVLPDFGEFGLEDISAIDGQIPAGEDVALVAYEEDAQSGEAAFRGTVRASAGDGV